MTAPQMAPPTSRPAGPGGAIPLSGRPLDATPSASSDGVALVGDLCAWAGLGVGALATAYGGIVAPRGGALWPLLAGGVVFVVLIAYAVVCWYTARTIRRRGAR